jgi:hypothetical protein
MAIAKGGDFMKNILGALSLADLVPVTLRS